MDVLVALLVILLVVSIGVIIGLAYLYFSLKAQVMEQAERKATERFKQWREQEVEAIRNELREAARQESQAQLEQWKAEWEERIRQDAVQRSQAVTVGKVTEHILPYLPEFRYNPKDARFIGSPIDFIVFDGLNEGEVKGIVFVEVKTGKSGLSTRERRIRDAVQSKMVRWEELRLSFGGKGAPKVV